METNHYFKSPLGWIEIRVTSSALKQLIFVSKEPPLYENKKSKIVEDTREALNLYFSNPKSVPDIPLLPEGTAFQKKIWKLIADIPPGETRTYYQIASQFGNPKAVRAVGTALGQNPILIFIPCHRVIGSGGSLTGYAGGIEKKRKLLEHEGYPIQKILDL